MARTAYFDHGGVIAMAHRGFSLDGHENSYAAFAAAVDLGFRYVETDVHTTADGVLVAFHDDSLDRVTDGTGLLRETPWAVVSRARIGGSEPIPTLDSLLEAWPDLRLNIDCKHVSAAAALASTIEAHQAHDRVLVASFSDATRREVLRRVSRPIATSAGQSATRTAVLAGKARIGAVARRALESVDCLQVPASQGRIPVVTPHLVRLAHSVGVQVHVWTINDPSQMNDLLDLGVDGLISDRADLLKEVLQQRDQW